MDGLHDLDKWQAVSHPELSARKPGELFPRRFAERYCRLHSDLWERIVHLHGTIRTLEQLEEFPFGFLYGPNHMEFWHLVARNFVEMSILLLHGLMTDQVSDANTLSKLKDEIARTSWCDEGLRKLFLETLRERKFDPYARSVAERVQAIRHQRIAHRLLDWQTGHPKQRLAGVSLEELRTLFDAVHSLFGALSFGSGYFTLAGDLVPATVAGEPARTCLDEVLEAVIRSSPAVNQPETNPWWPQIREHIAPEELRILNQLRKRIGLPEA